MREAGEAANSNGQLYERSDARYRAAHSSWSSILVCTLGVGEHP